MADAGSAGLKLCGDMRREQRGEVERYRAIADRFVMQRLRPIPVVAGALLSGSAARGDARRGPHGFMIDVVVVLDENALLDLEALFGESADPAIPFHCVRFEGEEIALEARGLAYLAGVRQRSEAEMFARSESLVLYDRDGTLARWKAETFGITAEQIRTRCQHHQRRFQYVTGDYRNEKWSYRGAWLQVAQNLNEAAECYCSFLHCLNGGFVPRRDWLVYLTCEMPLKPAGHAELLQGLYRSYGDERELSERLRFARQAGAWMESVCRQNGWM